MAKTTIDHEVLVRVLTPRPRRIVILTGAGVSAESGVATFRDKGGVWSTVRIEDVATPQAFARDPSRVQAFYNGRRRDLGSVEPNAAHRALAQLQTDFDGEVMLITQNVDDLHERGGSSAVIHMHGALRSALCASCGAQVPWEGDLDGSERCGRCGAVGRLRPDVVWFGEMPYHMEAIEAALLRADLFVSIGTSGQVYPAAGFAALAAESGARTLELNLEPSAGALQFDGCVHAPATQSVRAFVDLLLTPRHET
ncbi:MAG: NAD-dependent deacylase [Pseudomonadota bacterium]